MSPFVLLTLASSTVTLDPNAIQGAWEGWGTSLCWMGKVFGDRDDVADLLFTRKTVEIAGEKLPGLGLNIVRYNAGACSWNEVDGRRMVVSKTVQPYRQMEGFWIDPRQPGPGSAGWDWSVDAKQREMMRKAKRRGADRFELFSNSPMWWMCANDNPSGAADPTHDNLRPDQADAFAAYLAEVARHARVRWGVAFTSIEPFNEPVSSWWDQNCKQEGCHFSVAAQTDLLPRLRRELDRRGLDSLPIAASDETYVSHALATWKALGPETRAVVRQINVHGYEGDRSPRVALRDAVGDHRLWLSEHGENDATGLSLARNLTMDLRDLRPTAWCYWQPLDGGGWGLLETNVPQAKILRSTPKHFVFAQYTRHIRSGMTILSTADPDTVAAYDARRRRLVLVVQSGATEGKKSFDLSRFGAVRGRVRSWLTQPKGSARYEPQAAEEVVENRLDVALPPESVRTYELGIGRR